MLLEANEFVRKHFAEGSRPSRTTLRRWLQSGKLAGARKIGGTWFIDEAQFANPQPARNLAVDRAVAKILNSS